jgi:hypothetical protein
LHEYAHAPRLREQVLEEFHALAGEARTLQREPCDVTPGVRETSNELGSDRIAAGSHDDWDSLDNFGNDSGSLGPVGYDDVDVETYQLCGERWQAF